MRRLWKTRVRSLAIVALVALEVEALPASEPTVSSRAGQTSSTAASPLGFTPRSRPEQLKAETHALAVPTPENARSWLRTLTAEPHVAGTPADYKTAVFVRDKLREWGWKADLEELEVLLNYPVANGNPPRSRSSGRSPRRSPWTRRRLATDKDSASSAAFGAFNGYGVSGRASGQVVYVNYGRPEDYVAIEKMGIDVKGKIVLARYGSLFRGLKVRNAQKRGAAGILIFSDPADDGFAKGDVYPNGRFRPGSAIQRGSVQFLSLGPGDPSTPFGPSVKGAEAASDRFFQWLSSQKTGRYNPAWSWRRRQQSCRGRMGENRSQARRLLRDDPLPSHQLRHGPRDLEGPGRCQRAVRLARRVATGLPRRSRSGGSADVGGDGLSDPHDLERDRHDPGHGRARSLGHDRQPSRCLGLWGGRPGQRHGRDHGNVPRAGRGREERLEAAAHARVRELGRRGIRPGRLDRVGRAELRVDQREGRAHAQCRLGGQWAGVRMPAACPRCASLCSTPPARSSTRGPASRSARPGPKPIERPGRPARRWSSPTRSGIRPVKNGDTLATRAGPRPTASSPRWARSARAPTSRRFSTIWQSRRSTSASTGDTGSITRSTTTSTGWRSSATPSS